MVDYSRCKADPAALQALKALPAEGVGSLLDPKYTSPLFKPTVQMIPVDPFEALLQRMQDLHASKGHDYGDRAIPYYNCRRSEELGIPAWKGVLIRMMDKVSRLSTFAKQGELKVKDENIEDTLVDLANYALICAILYKEAKANTYAPSGESLKLKKD